jgi:hypothetical protein
VLVAVVAVLLVACGADATSIPTSSPVSSVAEPTSSTSAPTSAPTSSTPSQRPSITSDPSRLATPPPLVIGNASTRVEVLPYTFCFGIGCVDGKQPRPFPNVGGGDSLIVEFPIDGWTFTAMFRAADDACGREMRTPLTATAATTHRLDPVGRAATYDVELFGRGPTGGDVIVWIRWTTTRDGPLPQPEARMALVAAQRDAIVSYGVELAIANLATTPASVRATITATSAEGRSLTFEPTRSSGGCTVGTLLFFGPKEKGSEAAALGRAPFVYEVRLELDGATYVARARWPDDEDPELRPNVRLGFEPPLPAVA